MTTRKECIRCGETKELEAFVKDAGLKDGRKNVCKTCYNIQNKRWRKENIELNRTIQKDYYYRVVKPKKQSGLFGIEGLSEIGDAALNFLNEN